MRPKSVDRVHTATMGQRPIRIGGRTLGKPQRFYHGTSAMDIMIPKDMARTCDVV